MPAPTRSDAGTGRKIPPEALAVMILRALGLSCPLLVAACGSSAVTSATIGEPTVLRVGGIAEFPAEDLRIGLTTVTEDSRCAPNVVCIWEGVAMVEAWVQKGSQPRQEVILATTDRGDLSTRAEYLGYEIELLELAPPNSGSVQQADYRATLVVRGK